MLVNDRDDQNKLLISMIKYLTKWVNKNEGNLRSSIIDSINHNIAYVEVFWFNENPTELHNDIINEGRTVSTDMDFEEAFNTLKSSFDNIIFNQ